MPLSREQAPVFPSLPSQKSTFLLSPGLDFFMIGGASLMMFGIVYLLVDASAGTSQISWAMFYLAFAVNNPHFLASYQLLYWDKRHELFSQRRFFWAAIVVPILAITYMVACIFSLSPRMLSYAVNFMYFTVGWHYIKQIYGAVLVSAARNHYYFSIRESQVLKLSLYPVWFVSLINANLDIQRLMHYGIGYSSFRVPPWLASANYVTLVVSGLGLLGLFYCRWERDGKLPGITPAVALAAIYVWYLPSLYHGIFWYMIPFFHSCQYLLFVATLKKNQYTASAVKNTIQHLERRFFAQSFLGFFASSFVLAFCAFKLIPEALDAMVDYDRSLFGPQLFMFCFITFINIHHYFIDNVIWRRDNPQLKAFL